MRILISLFFAAIIFSCNAQDNTPSDKTFYIVRHAEKDTGSNPVLSAAGKQRAADLYKELQNKKIDLIFVSQYRRTAMTADSLRTYQGIDTVQYNADATGEDLFRQIALRAGKAKNILIVGHSNTVPAIVRKAGVKEFDVKELDENAYDNLFIVEVKNNQAKLTEKKYGTSSPGEQRAGKMNILQ